MDNYWIGIIVIVVAYLLLQWWQKPKANTKQMALSIWAAFGPYENADDAEDYLHTACRIVLGEEGVVKNQEWIKGHIDNFREWEEGDRFNRSQKVMSMGLRIVAYGKAYNSAFNAMKEELLTTATESLNEGLLNAGGHRLEVVKQRDGLTQIQYKQIWSDEKIAENKREMSEAVLNSIGNNLLNDDSTEALSILGFLQEVYWDNAEKEIKTSRDIGTVWLACLATTNEEPDSEVAKIFNQLSDAWLATREEDLEI